MKNIIKKINYKTIINKVKSKYDDVYFFIRAYLVNAAVKMYVDSFNGYVVLLNIKD